MATFNVAFDIGDSVVVVGRSATVKGITIGSDRAVYFTVEHALDAGGGATRYEGTTVPASVVSAPESREPGEQV